MKIYVVEGLGMNSTDDSKVWTAGVHRSLIAAEIFIELAKAQNKTMLDKYKHPHRVPEVDFYNITDRKARIYKYLDYSIEEFELVD